MANIINGTGTKRFAVPMYPRRAPNDDQKLEGNGGRKIWLSWLQCRNNLPSYHVEYMYPALSNSARSQIPRRGKFINESYTVGR